MEPAIGTTWHPSPAPEFEFSVASITDGLITMGTPEGWPEFTMGVDTWNEYVANGLIVIDSVP